MDDKPSDLDLVTRIREMYREDSGLTVSQIAARLSIPRTTAKTLFDEAHRQEMETSEAFADEAQRVEESKKPVPGRDPDFYIRDRETGMLFKLRIHKDTEKRIVFETEDETVQSGRNLG